jgi:simple sugar transport system ATP-binding protein
MIGQDPPPLMSVTVDVTATPGASANIEVAKPANVVLELQEVHVNGALDVSALRIHSGEIVGVAGVEGNGQNELAGVIAGCLDTSATIDTLKLKGRDARALSIRERNDAGMAWIPSDRHREGLVLAMSLAENLFLRKPIEHAAGPFRILNWPAMDARARVLLQEYSVAPAEPGLPARALSGGNQQKTVAARELSRAPRLILACNPTRGLDVGAAGDIQNRLLEARRRGVAVLLISSDLDEVLALSDRVFTLYRGKLSEVGARGVSRETVGRAMVGTAKQAAEA